MSGAYFLWRSAPGLVRAILLFILLFLPNFIPITKAQTAEDLKRDRLRGVVMLALLVRNQIV